MATLVAAHPRNRFDRAIEHTVHRMALANPVLVSVARALTYLGNTAVLAGLLVAVAAVLAAAGRRRDSLFVLGIPLTAWAVQNLTKRVIQRPRPVFAHPVAHAVGYAFPSGHATDSCAAYGSLAMVVTGGAVARRLAATAAALVTAVVAATRVVLGVHWLTDVVGGVLLAGAMLTAAGAAPIRRISAPSGSPAPPASAAGG